MKKIICLVVVILMIAAVAYAAKKVPITAKNVASLKGTWTGSLSFATIGAAGGVPSPVTLEILNDTVPVQARLTINQVPDIIASQLGITGGKHIGESSDGKLTTQGTIMFVGAQPKNFFEVTLVGEKKISIWYYFNGLRGDAVFNKKK